ncbi:MAG: DUF2914 domain-containing protein [Proteobacteria bacterium]|nr:MAG: DUF2914 domain-containing protein [Pseudomonadota bacterium]
MDHSAPSVANQETWKTRAFAYYERHELKLSLAFFLGGFVFDVLTLSDIDDPYSIAQQFAYLLGIGLILLYDLVRGEEATLEFGPAVLKRAWGYRRLGLHFLLGSLFSIYSLFFLKSASFFSSILFVGILLVIMVGNELEAVQKRGVDSKIALFVICLFCFFSMVFPVLLGHVGWVPFLLSMGATVGFVLAMYYGLKGRVGTIILNRRLLRPGLGMAGLFFVLYIFGFIPPVPLVAMKVGIYHQVEKKDGAYLLSHERPWWKFWQSGDQDFLAAPGDRVNFFVSVFSPARFDDQVYLVWSWKDPRMGWSGTDRIPMRVTGGRQGGYRGTATKANFTEGEWRISVETNDRREIGRLYFDVTKATAPAAAERVFTVETY